MTDDRSWVDRMDWVRSFDAEALENGWEDRILKHLAVKYACDDWEAFGHYVKGYLDGYTRHSDRMEIAKMKPNDEAILYCPRCRP